MAKSKAAAKSNPKETLSERLAIVEKQLKIVENAPTLSESLALRTKSANESVNELAAFVDKAKTAKKELVRTINQVQTLIDQWRLQIFGEDPS